MMWRMIIVVGVLFGFAGCQSASSSLAPTATTVVIAPTSAESGVPMDTPADDNEADTVVTLPATTTPARIRAEATPTKRRLRLVASATSIVTAGSSASVGLPTQRGLQFVPVAGANDDTRCVFVLVQGIDTTNWVMQIDGSVLFAQFTPMRTAFVCGLQAAQAVTFTILDANDKVVPGAESVSARGGDALSATWVEGVPLPGGDDDTSRGLRFRLDNANGNQRCIVVQIAGIDAGGWLVKGDGLTIQAEVSAQGVAELCGLTRRQEFTFSVYDAKEMTVAGGTGIPARGGDVFVAEWGDIAGAQGAATATPVPASNRALRFALKNSDDDPRCISVQISGIRTSGWTLKADGLKVSANFDGAGNARLCGLNRQQEFTFSVFDAKGGAVAGGGGIPARGGNIFAAEWR